MNLLWPILKKTLAYAWEELIYLFLFNVLTLAAILAGPVVFLLNGSRWLLVPLAVLLLLTAPPAIFGLFWLTCQVSEEKAVKLSTYFRGIGELWRAAYVWGGVNLAAGVVLASNLVFYANLGTTWAGWAHIFFQGLAIFWGILQLLALAFYPRLAKPGFRRAMRNALAMVALQPAPVVMLALLSVILLTVGQVIPLAMGFIIPSLVALLANVTLAEALKHVPVKRETEGG